MLESYVQGYNLKYKSRCTYLDEDGEEQICEQKVKHNSTTLEFEFPIDFVTSERNVHQLFPIDEYYFVLDSLGSIYIMKLPDSFDIRQPD